MRIVCPNCASQYEVGEDAIPEAGRDVQCAKCSEIWFQERPMKLTMEEEPLPLSDVAAPSPEQSQPNEPIQNPEPTPESTETKPTPQASEPEPKAEAPAVFRSLRSDRSPSPVPSATEAAVAAGAAAPVVKEKLRKDVAPEVKSILQEEVEFSAKRRTAPSETPPQVETPVAEKTPLRKPTPDVQKSPEAPSQVVKPVAEAESSDGITLASAKSLRDILEAEEIESVDITEGLPNTPAAELTPPKAEPSLDQLGMKRPTTPQTQSPVEPTPVVETEQTVKTAAPAVALKSAASLMEKAKSVVDSPNVEVAKEDVSPLMDQPKFKSETKSGKSVFADIDELNSNLNKDDEKEEEEEDLIDFEDDEVEKAGRFSVGFLTACILALVGATLYLITPNLSQAVPATEGVLGAYKQNVDNGRMVLQDMYYQGGEPGFDTLFKNAKEKFLN